MKSTDTVNCRLLAAMQDAEKRAWECLARYKFWMFGYYAARWVTLNHIMISKHPNPWAEIVEIARRKTK